MRLSLPALATCLLVVASGCRKEEPPPSRSGNHPAPPALAASPSPSPGRAPEHIDLLKELSRCEVEHRGRLFDFGGTQPPSRGFAAALAEAPPSIDRGGDTFERLFSRETLLDFWLDEPASDVSVTVRLHSMLAKMLYVAIDDKRLGAQKLVIGDTRAMSFPAVAGTLARGRHRLSLRFSGSPRGSKEPIVDLDWVRIGPVLESGANYAAPTLHDVVSDVVLDNVPKRSIVLRAPSVVRCFFRPSADAKLRVGLGFWGAGRGTAEIALVSDEKAPRVLSTRKISGGDGGSFTPVSLDLAPAAGELVGLELRAVKARVAVASCSAIRSSAAPAPRCRRRRWPVRWCWSYWLPPSAGVCRRGGQPPTCRRWPTWPSTRSCSALTARRRACRPRRSRR